MPFSTHGDSNIHLTPSGSWGREADQQIVHDGFSTILDISPFTEIDVEFTERESTTKKSMKKKMLIAGNTDKDLNSSALCCSH